MIAAIGRISCEVDGERVTVLPWTAAEMELVKGNAEEAMTIFVAHVEEPADAAERGVIWVAAAAVAWRAEIMAMIARLRAPPNRAARRQMH